MIIPDELLAQIKPAYKCLNKNDILFNEDDLCNNLALIKKGTIKGSQLFSDGHEKIIRVLKENECIGINLIFSDNPYYKANFVAVEPAQIILISKKDLLFLMQSNTTLLNNILKCISDSAIELNEHIKLLSYKTIREKFLAYLYIEYLKNKKTTFKISFTKTELASYLNVERPSLSTEISKLVKEGIIDNNEREYTIINIKKLESEI